MLQLVRQKGRWSLLLRIDGTRTHNWWAGVGESGSVGLQGQGEVAGGVLRGCRSEGVRLVIAWGRFGFHVRIPAWVVEVLVWELRAGSVGLDRDCWGLYCLCFRWLID